MYSKMMLAQALRTPVQMGTGATGGTQMPQQNTMAPAPLPEQPQMSGMNEGLGKVAGAAGQWAKDNYFTDNSSVGTLGPEAVKMGGQTPATTNGGFNGMWGDLQSKLPMLKGLFGG